jgi:hypothetical protein
MHETDHRPCLQQGTADKHHMDTLVDVTSVNSIGSRPLRQLMSTSLLRDRFRCKNNNTTVHSSSVRIAQTELKNYCYRLKNRLLYCTVNVRVKILFNIIQIVVDYVPGHMDAVR